jgi:hypothetical protein
MLIKNAPDECPTSKGDLTYEFLEDHITDPRDDYIVLVCCTTEKRSKYIYIEYIKTFLDEKGFKDE